MSAKRVAASKTKTRRKRGTGSRGPRVVGRNVPPAIVAMSRALRDARVRSGLSKADAATKVGVHFVTLYAWENENRTDQPS
jgi:ribosome-binding protein aMBF1 (putative translation factor)